MSACTGLPYEVAAIGPALLLAAIARSLEMIEDDDR